MLVRGRRRWGLASLLAVLLWTGLSAVLSGGAGARTVRAHPAACGGGGSSSFYSYGGGTRIVSEVDISVCVTGRLTVTFAGDPGTGCATDGVCEYSGTETYAPSPGDSGDLNLMTVERDGHRTTHASLNVGGPGSPVTSAVQRTVNSATGTVTTSCSDNSGTRQEFGGPAFALRIAHGSATIDFGRAGPGLLGSRCAGPLDVDIASVLPSRTVALRALARGERTIDLSASGRFAAHGLSGTVSSTLELSLGHPQHARQGAPPPRPTRTRLTRFATADYHVTHLTGDAVATVLGSATPAVCAPFDACGLAGTISVLPGAQARGLAFLTASSAHDSAGRLRAVLRGAGPAHGRLFGGGTANVQGSVKADLTQGGATCTDAVKLRQLSISIARAGHRIAVSLAPAESQATDPLRTRCPGPDAGAHRFASAELPAGVLSRPEFSVTLRGLAFTDGPYRVTTRSTLKLTLRRGRTHLNVVRLPMPNRSSVARAR